mmetsp:Transcript_3265/g.6169  ORF Transcript_3265/g.6169 Transcript_3265/m.6169 type:complete len:232 (+) Transcript_3265:303-998(+)
MWRPKQGQNPKKKRRMIPSRAAEATLRARIWDMLGLHHASSKDEIRKAYKEFVRLSHPDLNNGQRQGEEFDKKFEKVTTAYNEAMSWGDEEFFLQSYDCGITRMATKRVDGPSLNPWERKFRAWARQNDLLEVDELDDDVDARKQAKLYLAACEEDPDAEECDVETVQEMKKVLDSSEDGSQEEQEASEPRRDDGGFPQFLLGLGAIVVFFIGTAGVYLGIFLALGGAGSR